MLTFHTQIYDTSKKKRQPAWTDRVLWRGKGIEQLYYGRAELFQSDHRPVYADFAVAVRYAGDLPREQGYVEVRGNFSSV